MESAPELMAWRDCVPPHLRREFLLAAACLCWPQSIPIQALAPLVQDVDWDRFLTVVAWHRITGLVERTLSAPGAPAIPDHIRQTLRLRARNAAAASLMLAAESVRLADAFAGAGLDATFLKGAALAQNIYGDLGIRHSKDADILVAPSDFAKAALILDHLGYACVHNPLGNGLAARHQWHHSHHGEFTHSRLGTQIELHWRLFENRHLMPEPDPSQRDAITLTGKGDLRVLPGEDNFLYLCGHGARHGWYRLKWLADIAAIMTREDPARMAQWVESARGKGMERSVGQALLLAHLVLAAPLSPPLATQMARDPAIRRLVRLGAKSMGRCRFPRGLEKTEVNLSHYRLNPHWRYWRDEMANDLISEDDIARLPLPPALSFLYPLLRLPLWLLNRARENLTRRHCDG